MCMISNMTSLSIINQKSRSHQIRTYHFTATKKTNGETTTKTTLLPSNTNGTYIERKTERKLYFYAKLFFGFISHLWERPNTTCFCCCCFFVNILNMLNEYCSVPTHAHTINIANMNRPKMNYTNRIAIQELTASQNGMDPHNMGRVNSQKNQPYLHR